MYTLDEERLEGNFRDNLAQGYGKLTWLKENEGMCTYEGKFKDNLMSGEGVLTEPDGLVYKGRFKKGTKDGIFTITNMNTGEE